MNITKYGVFWLFLIMVNLPVAVWAQLPVVNLTLDDGDAAEAGQDPGSFNVTRSNAGQVDDFILIRVAVDLAGSATVNTDYTGNGWGFVESPNIFQVSIPANELSKTVIITPVTDMDEEEGDETVDVSVIENSENFTLGSIINALINIANLIDGVFEDSFE